MFHWQNILVGFIILLASVYLGRRSWHRLRLFLKGTPASVECHSGNCGGCATKKN